MEKTFDNIDKYTKGYQAGFKPGEGPIITFQITEENEVVCRYYFDYYQEILEALAYDHDGHVEFHDLDHYYDDSLYAVSELLKEEGKIKPADLESLRHMGGGFEDYTARVKELISETGETMSEGVEMALQQASFYNDVNEKGIDVCDLVMYDKEGVLDEKTAKYFNSYSDMFKHILALGGVTYGAVIHDKETKALLSGENPEILENITDPKIKEKIIAEISAIVQEQKVHYPEASAYLTAAENNKNPGREN